MAGSDRRKRLTPTLPGPAFILVNPQLAVNIGTAARAMLNCALGDLRLVAPRNGWPNDKAIPAAAGADSLLNAATLFGSTERAVTDLNYVVATTARERYMAKPVLTPREAAKELRARVAAGQKCGVLFGAERMGLVNDDLALADALVRIPLNPGFSSMNLAQSVMILAYEWFQAGDATPGREERYGQSQPADKDNLETFYVMLEKELDESGFLRVLEKRPSMIRNIRNMFQRAGLTDQEVRTLHGMVACLVEWRNMPGETSTAVRHRRDRKKPQNRP